MKYLKIFFIHIFITCCFFITSNIHATQELEDLTLSRIYVEPGNLEPEFSETRDYYTLLLNPDIINLIVQATPTNQDLKYKINGNENLKEGENLITITVYSKDNSKNKIYTINALKTNEPDKYNALLSTLIIDNYSFNEDFFPERFNYTTKNNTNDNKVEIFAYPQNQNATVEIKGNDNLVDGENNITITVTSENGLVKREYNINITKNNITTSKLDASGSNMYIANIENSKKNLDFKIFLITSLALIFVLTLVIFVSNRKNNL